MEPGEEVQVEAGDAHDGIVGEALIGDEEVGGGIPDKGEVVVGRTKGLEERGASSKKRDVLNIGVVFLSLSVHVGFLWWC